MFGFLKTPRHRPVGSSIYAPHDVAFLGHAGGYDAYVAEMRRSAVGPQIGAWGDHRILILQATLSSESNNQREKAFPEFGLRGFHRLHGDGLGALFQ